MYDFVWVQKKMILEDFISGFSITEDSSRVSYARMNSRAHDKQAHSTGGRAYSLCHFDLFTSKHIAHKQLINQKSNMYQTCDISLRKTNVKNYYMELNGVEIKINTGLSVVFIFEPSRIVRAEQWRNEMQNKKIVSNRTTMNAVRSYSNRMHGGKKMILQNEFETIKCVQTITWMP